MKNIGAVPQAGPIKFLDINGKPTIFNTPACVPSGANQWTCTRGTPLNAGSTWTVQATTRVDPNGVTLADCDVLNTVWLFNPWAADPGHVSQASQKVPQLFINVGPGPVYVYCDPPSLKLEKTVVKTVKAGDGYDTTFQVKATSTGPDPYIGTVEVEDLLPDGTNYVSSEWACVPTTGNDVHCSSPYKNIPVGKYTATKITIHTPAEMAKRNDCAITNTANVSISAEVLHSDDGVQYTASATAQLPPEACGKPPVCEANQQKPDGSCCEAGLVWNGKQCTKPAPKCPDDSFVNGKGQCVCDKGTSGRPGQCKAEPIVDKPIVEEPIEVEPICPGDSRLNSAGECVCKRGTEGRPGRCEPIVEEPIEVEPICPDDSRLNSAGECVCRRGTEGEPGQCEPIEPEPEPEPAQCPDDSFYNQRLGACACLKGTVGEPGQCIPLLQLDLGPMIK